MVQNVGVPFRSPNCGCPLSLVPFRFPVRSLRFTGGRLQLNFSPSAAGCLRGVIQVGQVQPTPGFTRQDCPEVLGDSVAGTLVWTSAADPAKLSRNPARLHFQLKDADPYLFSFRDPE